MKETIWGYWLILLGIMVIGVMMLVNSATTGTTQDYYMLKEVTQASMVDALDYSYYRLYGDIKMSKQKFTENFLRRFSEATTISKNYTVDFYDIYEVPPKVSVKVSSVSNSFNIANTNDNSFDLVNKIDVILVGGVRKAQPLPGQSFIRVCNYLDFKEDFKNYVRNCAKNNSECKGVVITQSNYPELYNWATGDKLNNDMAFKEAILSEFGEELRSKDYILDLVNNNELLKYAYYNGWITVN